MGWEAFKSPQGSLYYYNPATKESRWHLPTGPFDVIVPAGTVEARKRDQAKNAQQEQKDAKRRKKANGDVDPASSSGGSDTDSSSSDSSDSKERCAKIQGFKELQVKL